MAWDISGLVEAIVMLSAGGWLRVKVRANWRRFLYSFRGPKMQKLRLVGRSFNLVAGTRNHLKLLLEAEA